MTLRRAASDDLEPIMRLERASFPTDAWSDAMMSEELGSPHGYYVVDDEAGRLVGYAGLRVAKGAKDADIQTIAIAEAARGRGRGRTMLQELLAEAARRGVHDVFLEVRADNPVAQALYASEGFLEVGRRPRYYQPDDVDALVMKLDVRGWAATRGAASSTHGVAASGRITPAETGSGAGASPEIRGSAVPSGSPSRSYAPPTTGTEAGACT